VAVSADTPPETPLPNGVTIGAVAVGGLTPSAAAAAVNAAFAQPMKILYGSVTILVAPDLLGASAETDKAIEQAALAAPGTAIRLEVTVQQDVLTSFVAQLARRFDRNAVDARLFLRHLRPWLTQSRTGRRLDQKQAARLLTSELVANERGPVTLRTRVLRPKITRSNFGPVIVIRRTSNRLFLYNVTRRWRIFRVATGQRRYPTPLGRFTIVVKWRNPWWYPPASPWAQGQKPIPPGPGNPLGTRWMGLSAPGVGIHGTPDAASIGYSVSHGCIRMHIPDAEWLFNHVRIGTTVFVVAA
jgi:lipoprotein-anchoring transpeptidase ErfK/SrfK